jgi:beta-D-xylosidase 4
VLRYRVGYFDSPDKQPYRQLTWDDVSTPASEKLAYTVAAEGFVLLKNDGTLPLQKKLKKMALIGPWGNATEGMQGNYYGTAPFLISPLMGAMTAGYEVTFVEGTSILDTSTDGFASAIAAARAADVVVYAGGIDESVEAEGLDRTTIVWPGVQLDLIKELAGVGKPFIVLQFGAGQVDDSWLLASKSVCTYLNRCLQRHFSYLLSRSMRSSGRDIPVRVAEPRYLTYSVAKLPPRDACRSCSTPQNMSSRFR